MRILFLGDVVGRSGRDALVSRLPALRRELATDLVVVNAEKVRLTGAKYEEKQYWHHTGYPGGLRQTTARKILEKHPDRVLRLAIRGMLPKGPLGRQMLKKLKVCVGPNHPHAAQQPQPFDQLRAPQSNATAAAAG